MSIPIEGLNRPVPDQEKNDAFLPKAPLSLDGTISNVFRQGVKRLIQTGARWSLPVIALGSTGIDIACSPSAPQTSNTPEQPRATAVDIDKTSPSITPIPAGGTLEQSQPQSRYDQLFAKILKGEASDSEKREFNEIKEQTAVPTWKTEKSEEKQVPQIEGLRATYYANAETNKLEIRYLATADNPYGLKEEAIGGIFHKEVFDVKDSIETGNQIGGVGLKAEVIKALLIKNGSPDKNALLPIFADLTFSSGYQKTIIQETTTPEDKRAVLAMKIPTGDKLVSPMTDNKDLSQIAFRPTISPNISSFEFRNPLIQGRFIESVTYYGSFPKADVSAKIGDEILEVKERPFSDEAARKVFSTFNPPLVDGINLYVSAMQGVSEKDGSFPILPLSKNNLLRVGESVIFPLSNRNSILQ